MSSEHFEEKKLGKPYDIRILKQLYPFIIPYKNILLCSCALVILITFIDLSVPYITKIAIDRYIVPENPTPDTRHPELETRNNKTQNTKQQNTQTQNNKTQRLAGVTIAALLFLLAVSINFGLTFLQVIIMEYTGHKIMHDLRIRIFSHIQSLPISFFNRNPVGRLVTRATNDVQSMQEVFGSMIVFVCKDILMILGVTLILLGINIRLAVICFTTLPIIMYGSLTFARMSRDAFRVLKVKIAEINTRFSETIDGIKIIQLFRQEMKNYRNFKALNREHYLAGLRQVRVFAVFLRFMGFLDVFVVAVVIFFGGTAVLNRDITLGELVAFIAYIKMFFGPIREIAQKYNVMQNAMASAERILLLLNTEDPEDESRIVHGAERDMRIRTLEIRNISFAYVPDEMALKGVSFRLRAGQTAAIVGPTGSGKTTLINLMIRFYDPTSGRVLINGKDIRYSDLASLRSEIALVTQDPFLFSGTIRENIFQGNHLSETEQARILRMSNCESLLRRLPKGLDTELSERGASVSSGERQLISIARAFARDPGLIILDEATSYIDSDTEARIQEALGNLMRDRTCVIVAHRLSTAHNADKIIVLKKGEIIESGTYNDLMKQKGFYFKLNQLQK